MNIGISYNVGDAVMEDWFAITLQNILWGPCVKSNWSKGCVGFKGLGMSLFG